jgi:hypothetical protein
MYNNIKIIRKDVIFIMKMTKEIRDTIVTALYDRYGKGEISIGQREQLIQKINDKFYEESVTVMIEKSKEEDTPVEEDAPTKTEEVSEEPVEETECSNEKFDKFKKAVEEKCKNGEITEDVRDQLLEKAKEAFCAKKPE